MVVTRMWAAALIQVAGLAAVVAAIALLTTWQWALLAAGMAVTLAGVGLEMGDRRAG